MVNAPDEYQAASTRSAAPGLVSARGSAVEPDQVYSDCPDSATDPYDGAATSGEIPAIAYPSAPYDDPQLPCVVVSVFTNDAEFGDAATGPPKNRPLATAFGLPTFVTLTCTWPETFHTRYSPPENPL